MIPNPFLDAALDYAKRGLGVIALHSPNGKGGCTCGKADCGTPGKHPRWHKSDLEHGVHSATTNEKIIRQWWERWPKANVGIACGKTSGVIAADIDPRNGGKESKKNLPGSFPFTPISDTGGDGEHFLLKYPDNGFAIKNDTNLTGFPGIDIKSDGGFIVAPPSRHISGKNYSWRINPATTPLAPMPKWFLEIIKKEEEQAQENKAAPFGEVIPKGQRVKVLRSLAGTMRKRGMNEAAILAALEAINRTQCEKPLPDSKIKDIAQSYGRYPSGQARHLAPKGSTHPQEIIPGFSLSDLGNARRLVAQHGQDLRYCHLSKKWLVWTGQVWAIDSTGEVIRRAKMTPVQLYQEAAAAGEKEREAIARFALRSEHESRIRGMIALAQSEPDIPITPGQMDANPWLLNCLNGTVDLQTGKLRAHARADLITRMAPVEFNPVATCPRWEKFLSHIQKSNQDVVSFIQRILGYALTGDCREQCLFLLWGSGANGKSTLLAIISAILGNYAIQTPTETLLAKQRGEIPNDIARLNGPRFVTALEAAQGRRLAEPLVKQLTGQDTIAARFLFGEYFDFKPQFKLFLGTNHKPIIKDTSHAMWRRIRLIPFPVEIPDDEQDKTLPDALFTEAPGILAWMVRGCLSWQFGGLSVPDEVTAATGGYRAEMDVLGDFISECCIVTPGASAAATDLYKNYTSWADENGEKRPFSQKVFGITLAERGFERTRGHGGKTIWQGIGVKD
jgi:putative DNA primase/helicase